MSTTTPTLIFIPGGWHTAAVWDKVIELMEAQGHTCIGVNLPSCSSNPSATFYDDTQAVRGVILAETNDKNRNVVLVAWSYGGQVASSAIKGFTSATTTTTTDTSTQEEADGTDKKPQGRILGLALIASGFTTTGVSFLAATNNTPPHPSSPPTQPPASPPWSPTQRISSTTTSLSQKRSTGNPN